MSRFSRRELFTAAAAAACLRAQPAGARQATGVKVGEITPTSAVIWTRRTESTHRLLDGIRRVGAGKDAKAYDPAREDWRKFEGACPGSPGFVRVTLEPVGGRDRVQKTEWLEAPADTDAIRQVRFNSLRPASEYKFQVETAAAKSGRAEPGLTGRFRTAPESGVEAPVRMVLLSCQKYSETDRPDGFSIYSAIQNYQPDFLLGCGDNVYYDSDDPVVTDAASARYHWQRMFSFPTLVGCLRNVPGYWQKDDHDLLEDDCYPDMEVKKVGPFTFAEGQRIFRQQVPSPVDGEPMYRQFRWGRHLEIWLPEARDYRDPNPAPDSPSKSIWGEKQKEWLKKSLSASNASWKIVVNPNPVVGPDHARKRDNHANLSYAIEGLAFRKWVRDNGGGRIFLVNGDRHWQYHSVDPETGVQELGCGPASDSHAVSPSNGHDARFHKFLRIKGGYLTATVNPKDHPGGLVLEHRDVNGASVYRTVFAKGA